MTRQDREGLHAVMTSACLEPLRKWLESPPEFSFFDPDIPRRPPVRRWDEQLRLFDVTPYTVWDDEDDW